MLRLVGIGALGNMLSPTARHLNIENSPARFLSIYDRNPENPNRQLRRNAWQEHGAKVVSSYQDLFVNDDIDGVIICAGKNGDDVVILSQVIHFLSNGKATGKKPFILHCSTVSIEFVAAAYHACQQKNIDYVNYPLTGGAKGAEAGTMLILASGDAAVYKKLEPFLLRIGKPSYFGSDILAGAKIKLAGHLMVFNSLLGISSAVALQEKVVSLSSHTQSEFFDFLNQGAGGSRQWEVTIKQAITDNEWQTGFLLPHALIDAIYTADLLIKSGLPTLTILPILQLAAAFSFLINNSHAHLATQSLLKALHEFPKELEAFIAELQTFELKKYLNNIIDSMPIKLHDKVKLNIESKEFLECIDTCQ